MIMNVQMNDFNLQWTVMDAVISWVPRSLEAEHVYRAVSDGTRSRTIILNSEALV